MIYIQLTLITLCLIAVYVRLERIAETLDTIARNTAQDTTNGDAKVVVTYNQLDEEQSE